MIGRFPAEINFQGEITSLFQLSMCLRTLHQINARNIHAAQYLWLCSLIQSTCPGVFRGENYIGVGTNISVIEALLQDLNLRLYLPLF